MNKDLLLQTAIKASLAAGKTLLDHYKEALKAQRKESARDVVTEIDRIAENEIISVLKEFDDSISIVTEEQGKVLDKSKDKYWLIDALDGTVNYVNHIPFFSVSIAFIENDVATAAAVYVPISDDIYFGARGLGVFKNHESIQSKKADFS